jgi:hypothetical protein
MTIVDVDLIQPIIGGRPVYPLSFQAGAGAEDVLLTAIIPVGTAGNPATGGINQGDSVGSVYRIWKDVPAVYRPVEITVQNNFVDATLELDFGIYGSTSAVSGTTGSLAPAALTTNLTFAAERTQSGALLLVGPTETINMGLSLREMIPQDLFQEPATAQDAGGYDLALTMTAAPTALPAFNTITTPNNLIPLTPPFFDRTTITGITQANPAVVHDVAHGYSTGNYVFIRGVGGMSQVNGRYFKITVTDADHYSLSTVAGVAVDSSGYGAYTSGGTAQLVNNAIIMTLELIRIA